MKKWTALFTRHKTQKKKSYVDGFAKYNPVNKKLSVFDEANKFIDGTFCMKEPQAGDSLETDGYLVELGDELSLDASAAPATPTPPPEATSTTTVTTASLPQGLVRSNAKVLSRKPLHPSAASRADFSATSTRDELRTPPSTPPMPPVSNVPASPPPPAARVFTGPRPSILQAQPASAPAMPVSPVPAQMQPRSPDTNSAEYLQQQILKELLGDDALLAQSPPTPEQSKPPVVKQRAVSSFESEFLQNQRPSILQRPPRPAILQRPQPPPSAPIDFSAGFQDMMDVQLSPPMAAFKPHAVNDLGEAIDVGEEPDLPIAAPRRARPPPPTISADFLAEVQRSLDNSGPNKRPKLDSAPPVAPPVPRPPAPPPTKLPPPSSVKSGFVPPKLIVSRATKWTNELLCFPDKETCQKLSIEDPKGPRRTVVVPNAFQNLGEYTSIWLSALREEMNLRLLPIAKQFHTCFASIKKTEDNILTKNQQQIFKQRRIEVYLYLDLKKGIPYRGFTKQGQHHSPLGGKTAPLYLCLGQDKQHYSKYQKGDIWAISSSTSFNPQLPGEHLFLAKSVMHGPNNSGQLEVEILDQSIKLHDSQTMHCLNCGNFSTELAMLEAIQQMDGPRLPVLTGLLGAFDVLSTKPPPEVRLRVGPVWPRMVLGQTPIPIDLVNAVRREVLSTYPLNEDQIAVLDYCSQWLLEPKNTKVSSILLVHGVFGSGKSHMMCVSIIFLSTLLDRVRDTQTRILVSSSTNVAVDRILLGLAELHFREFMRIGSFAKINKALIPYTLHPYTSATKAVSELENLAATKVGLERENILKYLEELKSGQSQVEKAQKLQTVRVVGVTCAATMFDALNGHHFPIVMLDECSQMIEPVSLLPISKFGCEKLLLVGDPMQLPPQLSSNVAPGSEAASRGLGRTLFSRLSDLGLSPILLRTQYRLHPGLSKIVNELFYERKLIDGVTAEDRAPLFPTLPTLAFYDTNGAAEERREGQSFFNPFETDFVLQLLRKIIDRRVPGLSIGVICLYKAQETSIISRIKPEIDKANADFASKPKKPRKKPKKKRKGSNFIDDEAIEEEEDEETDETGEKPFDPRLELSKVQISTVDAFQGAERDVIIVSCTRTQSIGFTEFANRVNVALTRARKHLLIVGHAQCLSQSKLWSQILKEAVARGGRFNAPAILDDPFAPPQVSSPPIAAVATNQAPMVDKPRPQVGVSSASAISKPAEAQALNLSIGEPQDDNIDPFDLF